MQLSNPSSLQPLEAPVPPELRSQLDILDKALKENKQIYTELKNENPSNEMTSLESKVSSLERLIGQFKGILNDGRLKNSVLAEKIALDQRIALNIQKGRDQSKRGHSIDFLNEFATLNEHQFERLWADVQRLNKILSQLNSSDEDSTSISRGELAAHIQRFDQIFEAVASQVYILNEATEKLRDCFVDQRKKVFGQFDADPFEKAKEKQNLIDAYSNLKGVDAFPSANALLSLCEYVPRQSSQTTQPQFGTTSFGQQQQTGSLFGNVSKAAPSFSFNNPSVTSSSLFGISNKPATNNPLFGSPSVTTSSLFGQPATTTTSTSLASIPLFGSATQQSTLTGGQQQQLGTTPFSNTLNSASSGTLFKGSAVASPNRTLFGQK